MKIRIALIEDDELYLQRLIACFNSKYFDKLTIYSFSGIEAALGNMTNTKYDVVLAADRFDVSQFKKKCAVAYFANSNNINEIKNEKAVGKYQRAETIYKQILDLYSEVHTSSGMFMNDEVQTGTKIIGVFSACGGAGATSFAAAYAMYLASIGENVLYLNLEKNNSTDLIFKGEGQYSFADIIYALKSKNANLSIKLESCVRHDSSGVYFYSACNTVLDFLELRDEETIELVRTIKSTGKYQYIVVDFSFDFSPLSLNLMKLMYKAFTVVSGSDISINKLTSTCTALELLEEQGEAAYLARLHVIYNKFINNTSMTADNINVKVAGGIPDFGYMPLSQISRKIMAMNMFRNQVFK